MKLSFSLAAFAAVAALAAAPAPAANPQLTIPDFSHLKQKASDSVDITLDGGLLKFVKSFAQRSADEEADDADPADLLRDVRSVRVRNYEFDVDDAYSTADVEAVRRQLTGPGWSPIVHAHKRAEREDVDVFICSEGKKVLGLAVIASEPRSFTIVNIIGNFDIDKLAKLERKLGIPRTSGAD